jgi:hypothetical protein
VLASSNGSFSGSTVLALSNYPTICTNLSLSWVINSWLSSRHYINCNEYLTSNKIVWWSWSLNWKCRPMAYFEFIFLYSRAVKMYSGKLQEFLGSVPERSRFSSLTNVPKKFLGFIPSPTECALGDRSPERNMAGPSTSSIDLHLQSSYIMVSWPGAYITPVPYPHVHVLWLGSSGEHQLTAQITEKLYSFPFIKTKGFSQCSQEPAIGLYTQRAESSPLTITTLI